MATRVPELESILPSFHLSLRPSSSFLGIDYVVFPETVYGVGAVMGMCMTEAHFCQKIKQK